MSDRRLGLGRLLEGGLQELRSHPIALAAYVVANSLVGLAPLWVEGVDINLAFAVLAGLVAASPVSSFFVIALGNKLRDVIADPIDLLVRLVFAFAVSLLIWLGTAIGTVFFIVPGLYLGARWTLTVPLVLLEGRGIIEAMSISWRLTELVAWPLVGATVVLAVPSIALMFFAAFGSIASFPSLPSWTAGSVLQQVAGSGISAFGIAIAVFAYSELSEQPDLLAETFA